MVVGYPAGPTASQGLVQASKILGTPKKQIFSRSFLYVESELLFKMVPCGYCILVIFSNYFTVKKGKFSLFFFISKLTEK